LPELKKPGKLAVSLLVIPEVVLRLFFLRKSLLALMMAVLCAALAPSPSAAQSADAKISLDSNESLFATVAAINSCGYDAELQASNPVRAAVRAEIAANVAQSAGAAQRELCAFYRDHQQQDASHELSQYVSLALLLGAPPQFELTVPESDLPPGASYVAGFIPYLRAFYERAGLHQIWMKHQAEYQALLEEQHRQVSQTIMSTDAYLRLPVGSYHARRMAMYLEPMAAPGQVNARNYAADYFLVLSPDATGHIRLEAVRHIYLHYLLDTMLTSRPLAMKRLEAILPALMNAPMEDTYKRDISLLVTESLIRAIEARMVREGPGAEELRNRMVENAVGDGFVLTRPFYAQLVQFEKEPMGFQRFLPDLLASVNAEQERKRAEQVSFNARATPDVLSSAPRAAAAPAADPLDSAEARLAAGDPAGAQQIATKIIREKNGDQARALFILAKAALLSRDPESAQTNFERAIEVGNNAQVVAWSHVYLGRLFDMRENREQALKHYNAALNSGFEGEKMKSAAESGIKQPYRSEGPSRNQSPQ
jgi:tetratricopeptide (TPR) repeat protein